MRKLLSSIIVVVAVLSVVSMVGLAFGPQEAATTSVDLSGTYAGVLNCDEAGTSGDTTLTITGDKFTLSDGRSGRITTATTKGYTAVAMQFGEATPPAPGTAGTAPKIVSMRAKKSGDRLTLTSVPGAAKCSFMPAPNVARGRRNRKPATPVMEPVAAPAEPAANANASPAPSPQR